MSAKLLLIRTGSAVFYARAFFATAGGVYDRELTSEAELIANLKSEQFNLILCDARSKDDGVLELVERMRSQQHDAQMVLLCAKPQLGFIVKAIRLGVRDLFHPPINLSALLTRADELLKPYFAADAGVFLKHCRTPLTLFLADDGGAPRAASSAPFKATPADDRELKTLRAECDRLGHELKETLAKQQQASATTGSRAKDNTEFDQSLKDREIALAAEKSRQDVERESISAAHAELEAAQASASQASAALAKREKEIARAVALHEKAVQAHEEALGEFEASEQMLASREKALTAQKKQFEAARTNVPWEKPAAGDGAKDGSVEKNATDSIAAQVQDKRAVALVAREQALVAREKEIAGLRSRLEADAAAAGKEQASLDAAQKAFEQKTAGLTKREAQLANAEKQQAAQAAQLQKDIAALQNAQALLGAEHQAMEAEIAAHTAKEAALETKRRLMQDMLSSA